MALIEVFVTQASPMKVDPSLTLDIPQGAIVGLDKTDTYTGGEGYITLCNATDVTPLGIAGDSRSSGVTSYTAESGSALSRNPAANATTLGQMVVGAYGGSTRYSQNRVADNYNEVAASGKITVYHSGGEFWTDQYETWDEADALIITNYTPGTILYPSLSGTNTEDTTTYEDEPDNGGRFTTDTSTAATCGQVGVLLQGPLSYPNGVPGTDTGFTSLPEGGNSMTWGSMIKVKLSI